MRMQELQSQIEQLSTQEKTRVFWELAHDLIEEWPGIEKTSGVQGGDACVVRTRIPVWVLESFRRMGRTDEKILENILHSVHLIFAWRGYMWIHISKKSNRLLTNKKPRDV